MPPRGGHMILRVCRIRGEDGRAPRSNKFDEAVAAACNELVKLRLRCNLDCRRRAGGREQGQQH